jgi:cytochrome c peroxidase
MCHSGERYTDSGSGNPELNLSGPVLLHDVGTCAGASADYSDRLAPAYDGTPRPLCQFDTPSLNGLFDTPPYFHDGSAATLEAVVAHKLQFFNLPPLSAAEQGDLISFLRSL